MITAEAKNVNFYYGGFQALKDVSMTFKPNTVTALIGPSGCGKTTFLRLFNRMNELVDKTRMEGTITIDGRNIYSKDVQVDEIRRQVGMVFEKPSPFPKSIYENVAYGLKVNGIRRKSVLMETVERVLKQVVLWEEVKNKLRKPALALSAGQQRRLCLARALVLEPDLLLMDEPASALDPLSTATMEELIFDLKKKHTIIIATHNLQQAGRISDLTGFFYMGSLIEHDLTSKMFLNPSDERTHSYITGRFG